METGASLAADVQADLIVLKLHGSSRCIRRNNIYHPCKILHMYLISNLFYIVNNKAYFSIILIKQIDILSLSVAKQPKRPVHLFTVHFMLVLEK